MNDSTQEILRTIRRIELKTRRLVDSSFAGQYQSMFKGAGMNFEEIRLYAPGDEIRAIDWNVTARIGEPYIKKFTQERELVVMIMLDVSASGNFGSVDKSKREMAAEVAAVLAFSAIKNHDKVGLILFSNQVELCIPAKRGRQHILRIIREMLYFKSKRLGTDLASALEYMNKLIARRAVVFVISDFQSDNFSQALSVTASRHDLVALAIADPVEENLPNVGIVCFEDPETGEQIEVDTSDTSVIRSYSHERELRSEKLNSIFRSCAIDRVSLNTEKDYLPILRNFFNRRGRRLMR